MTGEETKSYSGMRASSEEVRLGRWIKRYDIETTGAWRGNSFSMKGDGSVGCSDRTTKVSKNVSVDAG